MSLATIFERWVRHFHGLLAAEISAVSRYYDILVQWRPETNDAGELLSLSTAPKKAVARSKEELRDVISSVAFPLILLQGNLNHSYNILKDLSELHPELQRNARLAVVLYNPYLRLCYLLANRLGIRRGKIPETFITETVLFHLAKLSHFEVVRARPLAYFPFPLLGAGALLNRLLALIPFSSYLAIGSLYLLRPCRSHSDSHPSFSIIVPARNERGNIRAALQRIPVQENVDTEVIFIEGHSTDDTWSEIQRVCSEYKGAFSVSCFQQTGIGKGDAVRLGFSKASKDILTILDADLSTPPELLPEFYEAYQQGIADFVNGNRLVYPMEGQAMRFLNRVGNVLFAKALSFLLRQRLGDSLCGTKLVSRENYLRMIRWRDDFKGFDPFGDYDLIFPAADLGLGIVDIPVRYLARSYGTTNIRRFYHGWQLLCLIVAGIRYIYLPKLPPDAAQSDVRGTAVS